MDAIQASYNRGITYGNNGQTYNNVRQKVNDNSTQMTVDGAAGMAAFGAIKNSSKIGNNLVKAIETSKYVKADKQAKILKIMSRCKPLAKYINNPIVKGTAGVLGGLSAATALVGSTAKIADTCNFLTGLDSNS